MKYLLTSILALGAVTAACKSDCAGYEQRDSSDVTLSITGMTSPEHCPAHVRAALESVPGVESVDIDFDRKLATVQCRGTCDVQAMHVALKEAGYGCNARY